VFDSVVYPFSKIGMDCSTNYSDFKKLFSDTAFFSYVEGSVNDFTKIDNRIKKASEVIR